MNAGNNAFRRKLERGAELRAVRSWGGNAEEDAELEAADAEEREKRRKVDDAARVEYLIRDAMSQGKFDNLKYAGKPIPGLGEHYDPDWWVKGLIQRERLSGIGPPAILLRIEDGELEAKLDQQYTDKQVRDILEDFNKRVIEARRQLQGGPPVITKLRDVDAEVQKWRERRAAAAPPEPEPEPQGKRTWWQRLWNGSG
ncbi:hypothetical protein J2790_000216 [Paenarthrobacter nicotinovorans]|uniref:DUF1992 domain-containing protein n=1 Tax=Paenarthrobacter nicotinovorans TaxID=29320 RepID=A0ABV0GTC8_PAENI|nr:MULTISPECIES: DUF1992 domain-containing protein [Micrococcaceae]MDR6435095.1 hypothetical protein [Paenarthrobacter nicotinovorans]BCW60208.1 hypothetical protein StoSoilB20_35550 [Arthrobacter sp. StoSoilB20]SCZ58861.1 protein of unknown function [Arthrobacter sp. UNCCL28]